MPRPRLQRVATARREKVQLRIREQSFYRRLADYKKRTQALVAKRGCE